MTIEAVKEIDEQRIREMTAQGYDFSKKPDYYTSWDWCGQCNRSLKSWDEPDVCDCMDDDEE